MTRIGYVLLALFPSLALAQAPDDPPGPRIRKGMQRFVDQGQVSGLVALVGDANGTLAVEALGTRDLASGAPMEPSTVFRVMSLTKPMTAVGILILVDQGKVGLDEPVETYLPEFAGQKLYAGFERDRPRLVPSPRPITVRDLLTHTSGLPDSPPPGYPDLDDHPEFTLAEAVKVIAGRPLSFAPGTKWAYSNAGMHTLGRVIEVVSGRPYDVFLQDRLFGPLGMVDTTFYPTPDQMARLATVYKREGGELRPMPWSAQAPDPAKNRPSPAGGLFSTAPDLARFDQMILRRGVDAEGRRLVSESSVASMAGLQTGDLRAGFVEGMGFGLGFGHVKAPQGVTASLSPGSFGHGGAYGTQDWIDPKRKRFVILLIARSGLANADDTPMRGELQRIAFRGQNGSE